MNLQQLQTNLCSLIKSRPFQLSENDNYLGEIQASGNLLLIRKIALWWRRIQIENCCVLTGKLLKLSGNFEIELASFFNEQKYSAFREEVGIQFLHYMSSRNTDGLTRSVAAFELAIIQLKLGENIDASIPWEYEPYSVIGGLLRNKINTDDLQKGTYTVEVSYKNKDELFRVHEISFASNN